MGWFAQTLFIYGVGCFIALLFVKPNEFAKSFFIFVGTLATLFIALALAAGLQFSRLPLWPLNLLYMLTSSLLLGGSLSTMILGHWYLLNAKLSFVPLIRLSTVLVVAIIAKALLVAAAFFLNWRILCNMENPFDIMLVVARIGAGIIFAFILAVMVLKCAKLRSNQSATGILYALVVFILIGELLSHYLTFSRGLVI